MYPYSESIKKFSPIVFQAKPIEWKIVDHKIIDELKSFFLFKDDFDLHYYLANLPLDIATFIEIDRQKITEKETNAYLKNLKTETLRSISSLQQVKSVLPSSVKNKILQLNQLLVISGSQYKLISENTPGSYTTMTEIRKVLEILCDEDCLNKLIINLQGLHQGIEGLQARAPSPKAGRKPVNLETAIIQKLIDIYINGTGLTAKCNWYGESGQYEGKFHEFLLKALCLLGKYIKIRPLSEKTWGAYARKAIKYYYRKR